MKIYFGFNDIRQDGMGSAALNLLKALKQQGIQAQPIHSYRQILLPEYYKYNPIFLTERTEMPPLGEVFRQMIDTINNDVECTHFSHFGSPNWGPITPYLRPDIKVLVSVHSITPSARKIAMANGWRTSKFIPISWEVENKLKTILPEKDHPKISMVLNAVDGENYIPKTNFEQKDKIRIIFFGRIEDYTKGVDKIAPIAKLLKAAKLNFEWDLYGYFHLNYEDKFYKSLVDFDVEDVIHYKGCLNPDEIPKVLIEYDIMVMPSNHEGFGLALIEAMACGLTCIASRLKDVTDRIVVDGKDAFLVPKNDIKGFANAIEKAAKNQALRVEMGKNARANVLTNYSLKIHGEKYKAVLLSALEDTTQFEQITVKEGSVIPTSIKPHILARLLPTTVKRFLKKYWLK